MTDPSGTLAPARTPAGDPGGNAGVVPKDTQLRLSTIADHAALTLGPGRRYACTLLAAGELQGHNLHVAADVLQRDTHKFANKPAHVNHHWWAQIENLAGLYENVAYDETAQAITAELVLKATPAADWLARLVDEVIADQDNAVPALNIGLSADLWVDLGPSDDQRDGRRAVTAIRSVSSVDVVLNPASDGARFDRILAQSLAPVQTGAGPLSPATPASADAGQHNTLQEVPMPVPTPALPHGSPAGVVAGASIAPEPAPTEAAFAAPQPAPTPASARSPEPAPPASSAAPAPALPQAQAAAAPDALAAEIAALRAQLAQSAPASVAQSGAASPMAAGAADLAGQLADLRQQFSDLAARQAISGFDTPRPQSSTPALPPGSPAGVRAGASVTAGQLTTPADHAQTIVDWMFGVQAAALPEPPMRTPRAFYHALTADYEFTGRLRGKDINRHIEFASGSTINLADLAANAMNKVLVDAWPALQVYRWFEPLVTVTPNDGSVHPMAWIQFGGIGNLPQVGQGGTYTELNVADSRENDPFAKYGGFVGVTLEMWRNNDMQRMQAIPRALAVAAVRTRSAAIAGIFTVNSGAGPTLDDDNTVLFHSTHGSNVQTTAFSLAAWTAADLECFNQPELGSAKPIGLSPKFALVPKALLVPALVAFGYGAGPGGYPGTANNDTNPYAEPSPWLERPVPIVVPDWTDANDWAYLVDKNLQPVIMMTYAQNPGGGSHPMPELFSVTNPTTGLVFTNDVLPIKVRDWFAYGVATWRGIGKRNVA